MRQSSAGLARWAWRRRHENSTRDEAMMRLICCLSAVLALMLGAGESALAQSRHPLLVSVRDPPALPGRHPEFDSSGIGMRNSPT